MLYLIISCPYQQSQPFLQHKKYHKHDSIVSKSTPTHPNSLQTNSTSIALDTSIKIHIRILVSALAQRLLQLGLQLVHRQRLDSGERSNGQRHRSPQTRRAHHYSSPPSLAPTQLHRDISPLSCRHAVQRAQRVNDERRQQQHYTSEPVSSTTRRGKKDTRKRGQIHRLGSGLAAHTELVSVLIHHRDTRTRLLEAHQVHIRRSSARHCEPGNALHAQRPSECVPCQADRHRRDAGPACYRPEPHSQTRSWPSSTPSQCPSSSTRSMCCGCCS